MLEWDRSNSSTPYSYKSEKFGHTHRDIQTHTRTGTHPHPHAHIHVTCHGRRLGENPASNKLWAQAQERPFFLAHRKANLPISWFWTQGLHSWELWLISVISSPTLCYTVFQMAAILLSSLSAPGACMCLVSPRF